MALQLKCDWEKVEWGPGVGVVHYELSDAWDGRLRFNRVACINERIKCKGAKINLVVHLTIG